MHENGTDNAAAAPLKYTRTDWEITKEANTRCLPSEPRVWRAPRPRHTPITYTKHRPAMPFLQFTSIFTPNNHLVSISHEAVRQSTATLQTTVKGKRLYVCSLFFHVLSKGSLNPIPGNVT